MGAGRAGAADNLQVSGLGVVLRRDCVGLVTQSRSNKDRACMWLQSLVSGGVRSDRCCQASVRYCASHDLCNCSALECLLNNLYVPCLLLSCWLAGTRASLTGECVLGAWQDSVRVLSA